MRLLDFNNLSTKFKFIRNLDAKKRENEPWKFWGRRCDTKKKELFRWKKKTNKFSLFWSWIENYVLFVFKVQAFWKSWWVLLWLGPFHYNYVLRFIEINCFLEKMKLICVVKIVQLLFQKTKRMMPQRFHLNLMTWVYKLY